MIETCAELCRQSYIDSAPGFTDVGDLRFGVRDIRGIRFVVIRGTANAHNWVRDARFLPARTCTGHLAHRGFIGAYRALCAGGLPTHRRDIVATGHSLGAAIATLLAEHTGCKLITFGSPRVYARFFSAPKLDHTRICCDDDIVTQLPKFLYSHRSDPVVLADNDHQLISAKDHDIDVYVARLKLCKRQI